MRTEDGKRTWGRYEATRSLPIVYCIVMVLTCAYRLDNIFRSDNIYFGVAIHISEQKYIFQSRNTYFRAAIDILEQHYIFQRRR